MNKKMTGWGGKRDGAGRKPLNGKTPSRRISVTIPQSLCDYLLDIGDGNLSLGIRIAAQFHKEHH